MPDIFDGMRISSTGLKVASILEQVVGQNIANSSNDSYSRQQVNVSSLSSVISGKLVFGQGVQASQIQRVRDELLDAQLRNSSSDAANYAYKLSWLQKIQSVFNEPSDQGINASLNKFWQGWSDLAGDPENLATRSSVMSNASNLANQLNTTSAELTQYRRDLDGELSQQVDRINSLTAQIAKLNADIFHIEAGRTVQSNDLRDARDAFIDKLSEATGIQTRVDSNGMVSISVGGHLAVSGDKVEKLVINRDVVDASHLVVGWEHGGSLGKISSGKLSAIVDVRDNVVTGYQADLNNLANDLITNVNNLYSSGAGLQPQKLLESNLGYGALGVSKATAALNLVEVGHTGAIHISFYDKNDKLIRSAGIVVNATDSLSDIAKKLDALPGLNAVILKDDNNDGRLSVSLDTVSGENALGETGFTVTDATGGYDTSGVLNLLGFSQTAKSGNTSGTAPVLASRDLTELQQQLGVSNVNSVLNTALNLSGTFTINAFETGTETPPYSNGNLVSQLVINVDSTDSINDIMTKVNALTANYGVSMSVNGVTNQLELTNSAKTDADGNVLLAGGTNFLRLGFANVYQYPTVVNDKAPNGYNGRGDNTGLLARLQCNTFFQGLTAANIALDGRIVNPSQVHAGYSLSPGDNALALAMVGLQNQSIADEGACTLGESYSNTIAKLGTDVQQADNLSLNEEAMLQGFKTERSSVSGVNLDEELANMIQYQRSYEANARVLSTFSQLADELLKLV